MSLLIKNGRVINPATDTDKKMDVLIEEDKIIDIAENIKEKTDRVIDAAGLAVFPGFVDMHVHFRVPGFEYKEDLVTGSKAALKGGVTSVAVMPNTNPVIDSIEQLNMLKGLIEKEALVDVYPIVSVTKGQEGKELVDFEKLSKEVTLFSDDGMPIMNSTILERALKSIPSDNLIISHCEDFEITSQYTEGPWPVEGEYKMVKRNIELSEKNDKPIHIAHISCNQSLQFIKEAKERNISVTCEVTPHHFSIDQDMIDIKSNYSKVNPPIRTKAHKEAMIKGIREGIIDIIATDHAPHDLESKSGAYENAANGISGIEVMFPLAYTILVRNEGISLKKVVSMMTDKPAKLMQIDKGTIEIGKIADLAIIDLEDQWNINPEEFISKGKNSPMKGMEVYGKTKYTIKDGKVKFQEGC